MTSGAVCAGENSGAGGDTAVLTPPSCRIGRVETTSIGMLVAMFRRRHRALPLLTASGAALALTLAAGCDSPVDAPGGPADAAAQHLRVEVVAEHPHNPGAYTQGLEVNGGTLYESTGKNGASFVAAYDFDADADPPIGAQRARADLGAEFFGEGITVVGDRLWQLTWREGVAFEREAATLEELRRVRYDGEGWGLCLLGDRLVMSDGTDTLAFRDPATFEVTGTVRVALDGVPQAGLNELECVDGAVYANIFLTSEIVRVDPGSGRVTAVVDAAGLAPAGATPEMVLNGIAAIPGTDRFLLSGKLWPTTYEVTFAPD